MACYSTAQKTSATQLARWWRHEGLDAVTLSQLIQRMGFTSRMLSALFGISSSFVRRVIRRERRNAELEDFISVLLFPLGLSSQEIWGIRGRSYDPGKLEPIRKDSVPRTEPGSSPGVLISCLVFKDKCLASTTVEVAVIHIQSRGPMTDFPFIERIDWVYTGFQDPGDTPSALAKLVDAGLSPIAMKGSSIDFVGLNQLVASAGFVWTVSDHCSITAFKRSVPTSAVLEWRTLLTSGMEESIGSQFGCGMEFGKLLRLGEGFRCVDQLRLLIRAINDSCLLRSSGGHFASQKLKWPYKK